ncbi:MAG: GNAT family N-acetyltransferase [Lachnospiraceae bacterium]|nr:GNAT family N-acetyltransferase [Lachnospiraceae bacterium]
MSDFFISCRKDWDAGRIKEVDELILKSSSNGEFINSVRFLDYHPVERFKDDSIAVVDNGSKRVLAVMMGAKTEDGRGFVSHPGTTFAGPILDRKYSAGKVESLLEWMLNYYEAKYEEIRIKVCPSYYSFQPMGIVDFFLWKRGYQCEAGALANVINISGIRDEDDIFGLFNTKRRNEVRKALKEDLFFFSCGDEIRESVWENMNKNLEQRFSAKTTHSYHEILDLKNRFPDEICPCYADTREGGYGAFGLIFRFKNVFHTQYLDLNYDYAPHYPNLLLIYHLIRTARECNYDFFSFGASTDGPERNINFGLYNYKAGYGGGGMILPVFTKKMKR